MKEILTDEFCDGCCYNDNPNPHYRCKRIKCCYLVHEECMLVDGYVIKKI